MTSTKQKSSKKPPGEDQSLYTDSTSLEVAAQRQKKIQDLKMAMKELELQGKILWEDICDLSQVQFKYLRHQKKLEDKAERALPRCRHCGLLDAECKCGYTG